MLLMILLMVSKIFQPYASFHVYMSRFGGELGSTQNTFELSIIVARHVTIDTKQILNALDGI